MLVSPSDVRVKLDRISIFSQRITCPFQISQVVTSGRVEFLYPVSHRGPDNKSYVRQCVMNYSKPV